jgi:hypothetical protein
MAMPIMSVSSITMRKKSPAKGGSKEFDVVYSGSAGPRELLELISIQARAAMKGLETGAPETALEIKTDSDILFTPPDLGRAKEHGSIDRSLQQLQTFW